MAEAKSQALVCEIIIENDSWIQEICEPEAFCTKIIAHVLNGFEPNQGMIDVLLCDNAKIQSLNKTWRNIDAPTNVLSFPQIGNDSILGSIALGFEICKQEASVQNKNFNSHLSHLLIHGVLHLLGYDHINDDEAEEMESLEALILAQLGIENPYELGHQK